MISFFAVYKMAFTSKKTSLNMTKTLQKRAMTEVVWLQSLDIEYDKESALVTSERLCSKIVTFHQLVIFISYLKINCADSLRVTYTKTSTHRDYSSTITHACILSSSAG